jgi:hypothetical protein
MHRKFCLPKALFMSGCREERYLMGYCRLILMEVCVMGRICLLAAVLVMLSVSSTEAVLLGQIDDFNDNTTQNWLRGNVALGGPGGAADPFLQLNADGGNAASGKLVTFNQLQWSGDYSAAGVGNLSMFLNNNGGSDLFVRIAMGDSNAPKAGGTWFASTQAVQLAPGSGWVPATFSLAEADLTKTQGPFGYNDVISNVTTLRLLHSTGPNAIGGLIPGMLGIDNITAEPIPEPAAGCLFLIGIVAAWQCRRGVK